MLYLQAAACRCPGIYFEMGSIKNQLNNVLQWHSRPYPLSLLLSKNIFWRSHPLWRGIVFGIINCKWDIARYAHQTISLKGLEFIVWCAHKDNLSSGASGSIVSLSLSRPSDWCKQSCRAYYKDVRLILARWRQQEQPYRQIASRNNRTTST